MSKKKYAATLNFPQTKLPMRANLPKREPEICDYWASERFAAALQQAQRDRPESFLLHDGPPYANGDIHTGHAVNKILKDMVVKTHRLEGFASTYVPGWDCHGLPIELKVEERTGKRAGQLERARFREQCRRYAVRQVDRQKRDFVRMGVQGDWDNPYLTLDPAYEAQQLRCLAQIVERGHLVRGNKPVHWCTDCSSALAEAEVEYEQRRSSAVDVLFTAADTRLAEAFGLSGEERIGVVIWTTTPWTLCANRAVCVHPEAEYVAVTEDLSRGAGSRRVLVVAAALAQAAAERYGWQSRQELGRLTGARLQSVSLSHPFARRTVPVLAAQHVTLEVGTGAVHTAPAHGMDDWQVGRRHGLDMQQLVGPDGAFMQAANVEGEPPLAGVHVHRAEQQIIRTLRSRQALLAVAPYDHSYPHCWRHGTALIFRATPQWFISMRQAGLLADAQRAVAEVSFTPQTGRERLQSMLLDRPDWCISRQRVWGVPLTLFVHRLTGEPHPDTVQLMHRAADLVEREGISAWDALDSAEWLGEQAADYDKSTDVLDVWFDSGASHYCVLEPDQRLSSPADIYLEGSDQHRGWFQSSLLTAVAMGRPAPYRRLITHGFVVDEQGNKMSKSRGNGLLPDEIWNQWGADLLRLWVASTDYRGEMALSGDILRNCADVYRRIRNTLRYLLGNLHDFDARQAQQMSEAAPVQLDSWMLQRAGQVQQQIREDYRAFRYHLAVRRIHDFCNSDLSAFYFDVLKDRLYTCGSDSPPRRSAQFALWHLLRALVRWIAPVLSFTAEEVWRLMRDGSGGMEQLDTVLAAEWHRLPEEGPQPGPQSGATVDWEAVRELRGRVNVALEEARNSGRIGGSLEAAVVLRDAEDIACLKPLGQEARFVLLVSAVESDGADGPPIEVRPADGEKCPRCWHFVRDIGQATGHPELCGRCVRNLGDGERRRLV